MGNKDNKDSAANQKASNENNDERKYEELRWIYYDPSIFNFNNKEIKLKKPDWNKQPDLPSKDKIDYDNVSLNTYYPEDYPDKSNMVTKIFGVDVRFYAADHFNLTLKAPVTDFRHLDSPSYYNKKLPDNKYDFPIIPSGVHIEILETYTHLRKLKLNKKDKNPDKLTDGATYWYVMCKIRVLAGDGSEIVNQANIDKDKKKAITPIKTGDIGYIWHTFLSEQNPNTVSNIGYMDESGASITDTTQRVMVDLYNNVIPFPNKNEPTFKITLSAAESGNCRANNLHKVKTTLPALFNALYNSSKVSGVKIKEINIGFLNYGGSGSHSKGKACDIWSITNIKNITYYYNKSKQSSHPDDIKKFEEAFMQQTEANRIWGPWKMYERGVNTVPNMINLYSGMLAWPNVNPPLTDEFKTKNIIPLMDNQITLNGKMLAGWEEDGTEIYINSNILKNDKKQINKCAETLFNHFVHRHHGHYEVR